MEFAEHPNLENTFRFILMFCGLVAVLSDYKGDGVLNTLANSERRKVWHFARTSRDSNSSKRIIDM